jgi:hypothetical protein
VLHNNLFFSNVTCRDQDVKWLAVTAPQRQRGFLQADPEPGFCWCNLSIDCMHQLEPAQST